MKDRIFGRGNATPIICVDDYRVRYENVPTFEKIDIPN